jgi:Cu-Zn family superoxide dismutase
MRLATVVLSLAALSFAVGGCTDVASHQEPAGMGNMHTHEGMMSGVTHAVAVIEPTKGNSISGTIYFDQSGADVRIHGTVSGLAPNSVHACHIHQFGDLTSADGMSAGSHYDPEGTHHHDRPGAAEPHHPGDMGNITADASGNATIDLTLPGMSLSGKDEILGRSVVIHAKADDFSQPVGNAGGRIGVGVIGVAKS